jgi:hypothetical protein
MGVPITLFREDSRDYRTWPAADSRVGTGARAKSRSALRSEAQAETPKPERGRTIVNEAPNIKRALASVGDFDAARDSKHARYG